MSTTVKSNSERENNSDSNSKSTSKDDCNLNKLDQNVTIVETNTVEKFSNSDPNFNSDLSKVNCEENFFTSSNLSNSQDQTSHKSSSQQTLSTSQMQTNSQGLGSSPLIQSQSSPAHSQSSHSQVITPQSQSQHNSNSIVAQAQTVNTPQPNSTPQPFFIQQPLNASSYLHQLYPHQPMIIQSGNLTFQNMPTFQSNNGSLSLQIPNVGGAVPLSNVTSKSPIATKGVAISPIAPNIVTPQNQMLSSFKNSNTGHMLKPMMPSSSSFQSNNTQTVFISPYMANQPSIVPSSNKTLDHKGKFAIGSNIRPPPNSKVLPHGTAQIQPKPPLVSQNALASQPVINPLKQITANNLIATPSHSMINSSILTLQPNITFAPAGPASALIAQNSSPFIFRNQSDQMFIQASSSPQISGAPIYFNQSGVHVVTSNATSSISVASSQSNTATNTTQALSISPQLPMIGSTSSSLPTKIYKPLRPANSVLTAAAATQTSSSFSQNKQTDLSSARHPTLKPKPQSGSKISNHAQISQKTPGREATTQTASQQAALQSLTSSINQNLPSQTHSQSSNFQTQPFSTTVSTSSLSTSASTASFQAKQNFQSSQFSSTSQTNSSQTPFSLHSSAPHLSSHSQQLSKSVTLTLVSQSSTQANSFHEKPNKSSFPKSDAANQTNEKPVSLEAKMFSTSLSKEANVEPIHSKNLTPNKPYSSRMMNEEKSFHSKNDKIEKKDAFTENDEELVANFMKNVKENSLKSKNEVQSKTNAKINELNRAGNVKNHPQKAIVKPQVLTHVIDGYVIHESPSPFPLNGLEKTMQISSINESLSEPPNKRLAEISNTDDGSVNNKITEVSPINSFSTKFKQLCENCGKIVSKSVKKNKKMKKFCSNLCAKKFSLSKPKKLDFFNPVSNNLSSEKEASVDSAETNSKFEIINKVGEERNKGLTTNPNNNINNDIQLNNANINHNNNNSPLASPNESNCSKGENSFSRDELETSMEYSESNEEVYIPAGGTNPLMWSVQDVYDFVRNLSGCQEYADEFRSQEIDGQALMLLKDHHLMSAMSMKLGPALKIYHKINSLKQKSETSKAALA